MKSECRERCGARAFSVTANPKNIPWCCALTESCTAFTMMWRKRQRAVVGDDVTNYRTFIKIPDEWRRKHEEQSVARTISNYLAPLCVAGFGMTILILFLREIKSELMKAVPWRRFAVWGLFGLAAY